MADDAEQLRFAKQRVIPSFQRALELFGVRPLIVPLLPRDEENNDCWQTCSSTLYDFAVQMTYGSGQLS